MSGQLITETDLKEWTGFKQRAALVNWLRSHGVPYLLGAEGRVCCTSQAINFPILRQAASEATSTSDIEF
ncbi:MAG: DUF4224 domain-containing protein [Methylosarcina sp.]